MLPENKDTIQLNSQQLEANWFISNFEITKSSGNFSEYSNCVVIYSSLPQNKPLSLLGPEMEVRDTTSGVQLGHLSSPCTILGGTFSTSGEGEESTCQETKKPKMLVLSQPDDTMEGKNFSPTLLMHHWVEICSHSFMSNFTILYVEPLMLIIVSVNIILYIFTCQYLLAVSLLHNFKTKRGHMQKYLINSFTSKPL